MAMRDLFDQVILHLMEVLERNRRKIERQYAAYLDKQFVIFKGRQAQIPAYPVVEIIRGPVQTKWGATRVMDETYNYFLDCSIKHASREVSGEVVTIFGRAVQLVLNDYRNLIFDIPGVVGVRAFDSLAASSDPGFRRAAGERTSRVSWSCRIANLVNAPGGGRFVA